MTGAAGTLGRADVLWREVVDGVLIRVRGDDPVLLTGSGRALWLALAEPAPRERLVERLSREHGVDPATVAVDLDPVISDLVERGIVLEL